MADEPDDGKPEPKGDDLGKVRTPEPLPPSEREAYEGKIKELEEKLSDALAKLDSALKPKPEPKRKSALERFSPL
jgi:hypothetical protein